MQFINFLNLVAWLVVGVSAFIHLCLALSWAFFYSPLEKALFQYRWSAFWITALAVLWLVAAR
jgi:hypothetical protein